MVKPVNGIPTFPLTAKAAEKDHIYKGEVRVFKYSLLSRPGSDNKISLWHKLRHMIYKSVTYNKL